MGDTILHGESTRKRLRYKEARLNARWRLSTRSNVNALSTKQDCGTYPCHTREEILILDGLNNVGRSLKPWCHVVIVMQ